MTMNLYRLYLGHSVTQIELECHQLFHFHFLDEPEVKVILKPSTTANQFALSKFKTNVKVTHKIFV
jgi:hypothetical protein